MFSGRRLSIDRAVAGVFVFVALTCFGARAADFQTLYAFTGGQDGQAPFSVIQDAAGNLYGATFAGGDVTCQCGTIFKVAPDGGETPLYSFKGGNDGAYPQTGLARDSAGNLYGATNGTGDLPGTVFKLDPSGHLTTLHVFQELGDGKNPLGSPILDRQGRLYGTTIHGGQVGRGTVYRLAPNGKERLLHSFGGTSRNGDGDSPNSALIMDRDGNLYGTTIAGGSSACGSGGCCAGTGCGTVFKVAPDGTTTILYRFLNDGHGKFPVGSLAMDRTGNLYGMTQQGGGAGTIFKLEPDGTKSELYLFGIGTGGVPHAGLIIDRHGNLFGTAEGGANGDGVAFELSARGAYTVLHDFTDANNPSTNNLILDAEGNLFGATRAQSFECPGACGTVFKITR
jgi:uncharacterized repeat protein (TIGR03803 family)